MIENLTFEVQMYNADTCFLITEKAYKYAKSKIKPAKNKVKSAPFVIVKKMQYEADVVFMVNQNN